MTATATTPEIQLVVHCWAGQLDQYAHLLRYQLSSLFLHPPRCNVTVAVCYSEKDELTCRVLAAFWQHFRPNVADPIPHPNLILYPHPLPKPRLLRRAIGRNELAHATTADVVWFAGGDYVFGEGALDAVANAYLAHPDCLLYPRSVLTSASHVLGDKAVEVARNSPLGSSQNILNVNPADFSVKRMRTAIGCLQIVPGEVARRVGYAASSRRYQREITDGKWRRTHEDVIARRAFRRPVDEGGGGLAMLAIDIPNLYRIRHSEAGRFVG